MGATYGHTTFQVNKDVKALAQKNSLEGDLKYYEIDEWRKREEPYLNDAEFVIVTEGGLNFLLNYGDSTEFYELIESFGYYIELGHSWNFGFYRISEEIKTTGELSYAQKLRDERWQNKRGHILERADYKCEDCGDSNRLEIHHCYYMYGYELWEYPLDSLRCLCRNCHEKRGLVEQIFRSHLAQLTTNELEILTSIIDSGILSYNRNELFSFLSALNAHEEDLQDQLRKLVSSGSFS